MEILHLQILNYSQLLLQFKKFILSNFRLLGIVIFFLPEKLPCQRFFIFYFSGRPAKTTSPPFSPARGPISITNQLIE